MIKTTDSKKVREATEKGLKEAHNFLRGKGFSYQQATQSALEARMYNKGTQEVEISGWHGKNGELPIIHDIVIGNELTDVAGLVMPNEVLDADKYEEKVNEMLELLKEKVTD